MKDLRRNYIRGELIEENAPQSPYDLFAVWFAQASKSDDILEPNAMVINTVDISNQPDSRVVLLKDVRQDSFVFYTNYESNKGKQLAQNSNCTLLFPWINLERQVIIRGKASKVSKDESDAYFNSRPRTSKIGAWASSQSSAIENREVLENQLKYFEQKYKETEPLRPPHWGGYEVKPSEIEFWQGRPNRLHDRLIYRKQESTWVLRRLQP